MAIKFSLSPQPLFLIPDIKSIIKFANGDLGIGDSTKTKTIIKSVAQVTSDEQLDIFKNLMKFGLQNSNDSYFKNGKYKVKKSDIILDPSDDGAGLKALEKSLIQSTFESQKPYMEIVTQMSGILVKVEDVIARVLSAGDNSLKPIHNPKALGYKPGGKSDLNKGLSQLKSIKDKIIGLSQSSIDKDLITSSSPKINTITGLEYQIISTDYSTGDFDPNVNYTYEYIDIRDDSIKESDLSEDGVDVIDVISEDKPKVIIVGIFDSNGNPIDTQKLPKWLIDSGKWFGQFNMINDFKYVWKHHVFGEKISISSPSGPGWKMKVNERDEPIIVLNKSSEVEYFKNYFNDIAKIELDKVPLDKEEKSKIISDINNTVDYKIYVDSLINSGFLPTLQLTSGKSPLKSAPFKPMKIRYKGKDIWIDPENDYDMKIIKVSPTLKAKQKNTIHTISSHIDPIGSRLFKKNKILPLPSNKQLLVINMDNMSSTTPYSKEYYGSSSDDNKQNIEDVLQYVTKETETYYIVEGILESSNEQSFPIDGSSSGGSKYYKKPKGPISAVGAFIKMIVDIFSKLIPAITSLLKILSNPASFVVDEVILKKLGDNNGTESPKFDIFSKVFKKDFEKLKNMNVKDRKKFAESSPKLKKYVHVDESGEYKFLMDGSSLVKFLGITFGIGLNKLVPKLTFKANQVKNDTAVKDFLNLSNDQREKQVNLSNISNNNLNPKLDIPTNRIVTTANGITTIEEVSIQYSTGEFISGVDYEYIYVTQYINDLIIEAEKLEQIDDEESQNLALVKYEEALQSDPNNKDIKNKLDNLKNKTGKNTQSILDVLLNLVTFPLKIVKGIIEYILDFFKSLSDPFKLPSQIKEFISFKWILDFFNPNKILEIIGIKFDIPQFANWIKNIDSSDKDQQFDLDKIVSMPFVPKLFTANKEQLSHLTKTPMSMISSILCLIESIINSVIDFIWSLMGLSPILDAPHIKLCKDTNKDIYPNSAMGILNGDYIDASSSGSNDNNAVGQTASYDFVYDITLPDGRILRSLNYEELTQWKEENKDIQFELDF